MNVLDYLLKPFSYERFAKAGYQPPTPHLPTKEAYLLPHRSFIVAAHIKLL